MHTHKTWIARLAERHPMAVVLFVLACNGLGGALDMGSLWV